MPILGCIAILLAVATDLSGQTAADSANSPVKASSTTTVESLYADFLHYARMGKFDVADAYAQSLFTHPELDAIAVLRAADKDLESLRTLQTLINKSTIPESAQRVLDLIVEGQNAQAKQPARILRNIELLGGDPQQEAFATRQLIESGEYAIPYMMATLHDPQKSKLWPRVIFALPKIGKAAVNPLVMALSMKSNDIRLHVIEALGEIGYPQAIPYLRKLLADDSKPVESKEAAQAAIERIEQFMNRPFPGSAQERFFALGEHYYNERDSVRADPRLAEANVWYWNDANQELTKTAVPQKVFGQVMAMRSAQEALHLQPDHSEALALWLAANIRRESRLGLNTESGDPSEQGEADATEPGSFPRALYFTQSAGPRYAHMVLDRAVADQDSAVALGAIEALRTTAGEASLVGTEDYKQPLVRALQFPDLVVRLRAALALGVAMPKSQFTGSQYVVPLLATALGQTGREQVLVVDTDQPNLNRVAGALRGGDRDVIAESGFLRGLDRARTEFQTLTGIFMSTNMDDVSIAEAIYQLRGEFILAKTPVVMMTGSANAVLAEELSSIDPNIEVVPFGAAEADLMDAFARVRKRSGQTPFDAKKALAFAIQAGETLRGIAADGRTIFDVAAAEPALIGALGSEEESLQVLSASVLALLPASTAQRAIAHVSLDSGNSKSLRLAAFGSLAESARRFGSSMESGQVVALVKVAHEDSDLVIRTAASQALGAANLEANRASEIVRSYFGG